MIKMVTRQMIGILLILMLCSSHAIRSPAAQRLSFVELESSENFEYDSKLALIRSQLNDPRAIAGFD